MDLNVTSTLQQLLEAHSISCQQHGAELLAGNMSVSAWIIRKASTHIRNLLQLDIRVHSSLLGGRTLIESFAGWGDDEAQAINAAWEKFSRSSLHVLLAAFIADRRDDGQVEWETWDHDGIAWNVCMGPLFNISFSEEPLRDLEVGGLLDQIRDALLPGITRECHWLRFYYMKRGDERIGSECLLDNEPWPDGQKIVDQSNWPDGDYSVRHFLVLLPGTP
jgi:hypothetical protein